MSFYDAIRVGASGAADYEVERSLRFNDDDSPGLSRTPSSAGNTRTFTISAWVKRSSFGSGHTIFSVGPSGSNLFALYFPSGQLSITEIDGGSQHLEKNSTALFRDTSAWLHVVGAIDTTQSIAEDRIIIYVNGERITDYAANTIISQNTDLIVNSTNTQYIGRMSTGNYFDGYIAEFNFIDGLQLTPSSFAETDPLTGQWNPKKYVGSYGTNGFYLNFSDNSGTTATTLGKDSSGNGNNFTPNNLATTDAVKDSPTNNFCTHNPLDEDYSSTSTFSEGNLQVSRGTDHGNSRGTMGMSSGKWYFEYCFPATTSGSASPWCGVCTSAADMTQQRTDGMWNYGASSGQFLVRGSGNASTTDFGSARSAGTVVGVAVDMDNKKIWLADSNTWFGSSGSDTDGNPSTGANPTDTFTDSELPDGNLYPQMGIYNYAPKANFGQDSSFSGTKTAQGNTDANGIGDFFYAPPTGYKALCSANLPDPTILLPNQYFDTFLYTATGNAMSFSGLNFQPDWIWQKRRDSTGGSHFHYLFDAVRGGRLGLQSNTTGAEFTGPDPNITFTSNGYDMAASTGGQGNASGGTYVSWNWNAGGSTVTNTNGNISSQVRANTTAGFSIVSYSGNGSNGQTVGHGLGVAPDAIILKCRTASQNWRVWHRSLAADGSKRLLLDSNNASENAGFLNDTAPTSTVFTLGNSDEAWNESGDTYIVYVFSGVEGFSKFGAYTGNGSADGTFVYTGFRPAWIMYKSTSATENWQIKDSKRVGYNDQNHTLFPNNSNAEYTTALVDFLSNGFKFRVSDGGSNGSSESLIYLAFAESPFKNARAR